MSSWRAVRGETMRHVRGAATARLPDVRRQPLAVRSRLAGLVMQVDAFDRAQRREARIHGHDAAYYGSRPGQRASPYNGREMWQQGRNDGGQKQLSRKLQRFQPVFKPWE